MAKTAKKETASKSTIALQNSLVIVPEGNSNNTQIAVSIQAELMNLGFMLDEAAFRSACKASREWLLDFHKESIAFLRKKLGANRHYKPFYRNFPTQVMEMSEFELFVNAFIHYLSDGKWEPSQKLKERGVAFEATEFKVIKLANENDFRKIFTRLCSINQSITGQDKETLEWFIENYKDGIILPDVIPFKETLCILAAKGLPVPVKMATDVLRVAVYLSGGDISLPSIPKTLDNDFLKSRDSRFSWFYENIQRARLEERNSFKFKKFKRPERRQIMALLEKTSLDLGEMQGRLGRWLRLGEFLHTGEFSHKFPRTAAAFNSLRNQAKGEKIRTFHGRVDLAFAQNWKDGLDVLTERPGEFARKLDWLIRTFDEPKHVMKQFSGIGSKVSSKVLFELWNHFEARTKPESCRSVMIKGKRAKLQVLEPLPPLDEECVNQVRNSIMGVIGAKISKLPKLGNVWIDERLKDVPVPFSMRNVNSAIRTYVRGTRIPFKKDAKVIRPFIHWYDDNGTIDLDLSVGFYSENLHELRNITFRNLRERDLNCCHSGDIRHRVGACAEYVDIDVEKCLAFGIRYALVQVYNYDGRPMHEVKDAVFGLMERENAVANEIFVPKTISDCMGLANEGTAVLVCILDLKEHNYIWADIEADRCMATLENNRNKAQDTLQSLLHGTRMSVYDLLKMHAEARGKLVPSASEAKVSMQWENFVTSYAKVAEYMTF